MTKIAAGEFKAKCLHILDQVKETREPVTVTKRGKPVAVIVPVPAGPGSLYGIAKGEFGTVTEDMFSTGEIWEAEA